MVTYAGYVTRCLLHNQMARFITGHPVDQPSAHWDQLHNRGYGLVSRERERFTHKMGRSSDIYVLVAVPMDHTDVISIASQTGNCVCICYMNVEPKSSRWHKLSSICLAVQVSRLNRAREFDCPRERVKRSENTTKFVQGKCNSTPST